MTRSRTGLAAAIVVAVLAIAGCGGDEEATPADTGPTTEATVTTEAGGKLVGSVASDDFVITLTGEDGSDVTALVHGTYTLQMVDKTNIHNFHLTGPGVDVSTEVGGQSDEEVEVELQAGTYTFVCDPHASTMRGSFEVT
ncbi:MAG TPA: plastocyanin/azurin family copper-binding protein [Gaiellaceae bacterium]|nr:plastocyanin/azurin family copper-binding protein [Gaiellaceae bacterium]